MSNIRQMRTARDVMQAHVHAISPEASLSQIIQYLLEHEISNAPVVTTMDGEPVLDGFISEADCMEHLANELFYGNPAPHLTAELIMKRHPVCVAPDTNLFTLASIFIHHRLRHLPVVDGRRLLGIVSRRDVLQELDNCSTELAKAHEAERHPLDMREIINHRFIAHE